jgi:hypothetical protein
MLLRGSRFTTHHGLALFFVELRNQLLSQFNHFVWVFFVLNSTRQLAPIACSG